MKEGRPHPAKYSDELIPVFAEIVARYKPRSILDPMGGVGKIALLERHGYTGRIVVNEIEPEWLKQAPLHVERRWSDAARMGWARDGEFDAIITSPTYGNRMADHHDAKDGSRRYTYRHTLGRPLSRSNTGRLQWGRRYKEAHIRIWTECVRVLRNGGVFVLNCKDHIRKGEIVPVTDWHVKTLISLGLRLRDWIRVPVRGMRNGANHRMRVDEENVVVLRKQNTKERKGVDG